MPLLSELLIPSLSSGIGVGNSIGVLPVAASVANGTEDICVGAMP